MDTKGQRLPYFDNLVYTVVPNMNAINLRFLSGESDAIDMINPDAYDQFKTAAANGRFELKEPASVWKPPLSGSTKTPTLMPRPANLWSIRSN
ncbi:MAG: hypothetical protein WDN00_06505 [Limisphaerales bacterium]